MPALFSVHNIILFISLFVFVFVFWSEAKRDGFDKNSTFDVIFTLLVLSGMLYLALNRWFLYLNIYQYNSIFLKFDPFIFVCAAIYTLWVLGIFAFSDNLNWSSYRLLDTFAVAQVFSISTYLVSQSVLSKNATILGILLVYLFVYKFLVARRGSLGIMSGISFALITLLHTAVLFVIPTFGVRLPIAVLLLTITSIVIYFRRKKSMSKTNLTKDFLDFVSNQLHSKEKQLQRQEELIKNEDPYLQAGRSEDNSEEMDEAILEDSRKEISDVRMGVVKSMRLQVKRALAFLKIGKYGVCEICGNPIDPARLKVYPEATTCVEHSAKSGR